jgi:hypothetical protein
VWGSRQPKSAVVRGDLVGGVCRGGLCFADIRGDYLD